MRDLTRSRHDIDHFASEEFIMRITRPLLALSMFTISISAHAAETAGAAILECSWKEGGVEYFKVSASSWQQWDEKAWAWQERPCKVRYTAVDAPECTISVDDNQYQWKLHINQYLGDHEIWTSDIENAEILIDRRNGDASYNVTHKFSSWNLPTSMDVIQLNGTCKKSADPALKTKPAPIL